MTYSNRPFVATARPASAKQISFLTTLCEERGQELPEDLINLSSREASALIDGLLKTPRQNAPERPQEARKALMAPEHQDRRSVDLSALRSAVYQVASTTLQIDVVSGGRWDGWAFVKTVTGDRVGSQRPGQYYRGESTDVLLQIVQDPTRALIAYAIETGVCGACQRELSDDLSRAAGIGPTCAKSWGIDRLEFKALADEMRAEREAREEKLAPIRASVEQHVAADESSWDAVRTRVEEMDVDSELAGIQAASVFDAENPFDFDPDYVAPVKKAYVGPDSLPATPCAMDGDWS